MKNFYHLIPFLLICLLHPNGSYAQEESKSAILVNPPNTSVTLSVAGNQKTDLTLKNSNLLGVLLRVPAPKPYQGDWNVTLLPFSSATRQHEVFSTLPVYWSWTVSTYSDAANVLITATWPAF